jgi:hypothetical protein
MLPRWFLSLLLVSSIAACGGGGGGSAASVQSPQAAKPASPAPAAEARLVTLIGSRESEGLHWIIAGDGFTTAQFPALRETALALAREMIEAPELAAHASVWNVHLLETGSRETGVDDAARGIQVDTAFDGQLGCGSNSRVACVDWEKITAALRTQGAPSGELTVILNTDVYVGSANASGIIVSRNAHAPRIVVHELGHRVAGLADEYVDAVVAEEWRPFYVEGRFANVTTVAAADQAPWRHWLADSTTGVGLFEGAFYVSNGFYRPKLDSIMRTLEAPLGEVNAEAWLRAQYRALPPLARVSPAVNQTLGIAGETLEFSVICPWPREAVSLQWYVDGVEVPEARDSSSFHFPADGGNHRVEVRARDVTGRLRAPDVIQSLAEHAWQVSSDTPAAAEKSTRSSAPLYWLKLRVDAAGHTVVGKEAAGPVHRTWTGHEGPDWHYALLGEDGEVIATGSAQDPRLTRSALSPPGDPQAGHARVRLESGHYFIGVPRGLTPRKLRISASGSTQEKPYGAGQGPGEIEIELDPR